MISAPREIFGENIFGIFVDELGMAQTCSILGVHPASVRRWLRGASPVPRMAVLALYWETQYGRSLVHSDQVNEIRLLYRKVCILQDQYAKARDVVAGLRRMHTGTANEAFFDDLEPCYPVLPHSYQAPETVAPVAAAG